MLQQHFKKINKTYFNSLLPEVPIIIRNRPVKIIQGYLTFGDTHRTKPEIIIYSCWNKDIQILLHEMIHLEQWINKCPIRHNNNFKERERLIIKDMGK